MSTYRLLWICLGGALGTGTRYLVSLWAGRALGSGFPYGTLFVNVAGCFLIAAITHVSLSTTVVPPALRLAATTGFMGGLTTYSTFNFETTRFLHERAWGVGLLNFALTTGLCFGAGLLGLALARKLVGT